MSIRLPVVVLLTASLLSSFPPAGLQNCFAQSSSKPTDPATHQITRAAEPPFDKLELFGLFAAGPTSTYAAHMIEERGTNFTPDANFISSFPVPAFQAILKTVKPRASRTSAPDRDQAYELLRKAYNAQRNRQFVSSGETYQQALQLAPNSATLHLAYAADLMLSHNFNASDEQSRLSLKLWPEYAEAHGMRALSMTLQKRFPEAELESRETLRIFPQHPSAKFTLAHSLTNQRKYKEALPAIREAMAATPSMTALRKFLGIALVETGDTASGIEQLSSYVKIAPDDAEGHYYLGVALRLKSSSSDAHAEFLEALRLQPNNPQYEVAAHPGAAASTADTAGGPKPEDGSVSENIYTNRFFGFTYQFPKGWAVLSSEAAKSMVEIGGIFLATGDPAEEDVKKAVERQSHPLLFVMEGRVGNQPISTKTVMVTALDVRHEPEQTTAEVYARAVAQRFKQAGMPMEPNASPEERSIGGRSFWKVNFSVRTAAGVGHGTEFVTADKGYLLMFVLGGPDLASLGEVEKSLQSIHFLDASK
jgi:tetratricopeptide (TPR) repeat protein